MLTRYLARFLVSVVTLAGGTLIAAAPALAHWDQCPDKSFCVWVDWDATGLFAYFNTGSNDLRRAIGGHVFDNAITSIWNRSDSRWCVWSEPFYEGQQTGFGIGGQGNVPAVLNDTISSLKAC